MKSKVIALVVSGLVATSAGAAEKPRGNKEESIGVGSGAAIGALAGGPIGLIVGAAFGGWLGDRINQERVAREDADARYTAAHAEVDRLETRLAATERIVAQKDAVIATVRAAHRRDLTEALSVEVFFRTEDSGLAEVTEQRLEKLAAMVAPLDGAVIHLEGHADARGTEAYNNALSVTRAEAVRDALIRGGMPAERIIVAAAGEADSTAPEQDSDGMALERRVAIGIVDVDGTSRVASQRE